MRRRIQCSYGKTSTHETQEECKDVIKNKMPLFGVRLKELRLAKDLSQAKLADAAGVSLSVVFKAEQGVSCDPPWSTVQALAEALGVDCTAFTETRSDTSKKIATPTARKDKTKGK
jgi:transcriptional regulator with XRE-family HTH domain